MKRWRGTDFWFELTQGPDPTTGRAVRYVLIRCRKCNTTTSVHAHGMSPEKLKKYFMRQRHWDIGKTMQSHTCPACLKIEADVPAPTPEPTAPDAAGNPPLYLNWLWATEAERRTFLFTLAGETEQLETLTALLRELGIMPVDEPAGFTEAWLHAASADEIAVAIVDRYGEDVAREIAGLLLPRPAPPAPKPYQPDFVMVEPEPEPEPEPTDETPADWWLELQQKRQHASAK